MIPIGSIICDWRGNYYRVERKETRQWNNIKYEILLVIKVMNYSQVLIKKGKKLYEFQEKYATIVNKEFLDELKKNKLIEYQEYCKGLDEIEKML